MSPSRRRPHRAMRLKQRRCRPCVRELVKSRRRKHVPCPAELPGRAACLVLDNLDSRRRTNTTSCAAALVQSPLPTIASRHFPAWPQRRAEFRLAQFVRTSLCSYSFAFGGHRDRSTSLPPSEHESRPDPGRKERHHFRILDECRRIVET